MRGGLWTPHEQKKAGMVEDDKCPSCGHPCCDLFHVLWKCPEHHERRASVLEILSPMIPEDVPRMLSLHGIAPRVSAGSNLWVGREDSQAGFSEAVQALFTEPCCQSWCSVHLVGITQRGSTHFLPSPAFRVESGGLPLLPNVFTDGSVASPSSELARGGWGMHLCDDIACLPHELRAPFECHVEGGSPSHQRGARWCPLRGAHISSTRAEAMALLATMFLPRPICAASDSQVAVDRLKMILGDTNQCPPITGSSAIVSVAGPWGKSSKPNGKDADIWILMARALRARGPHTFDVLKVKAHCSRQQMEEGQISHRSWLFNQAADSNASMGTMPLFGSQIVSV